MPGTNCAEMCKISVVVKFAMYLSYWNMKDSAEKMQGICRGDRTKALWSANWKNVERSCSREMVQYLW